MAGKSNTLTALAAGLALATSPIEVGAKNPEINKDVAQVTCSTKLACEKLSISIQAQIDELKNKGLRKLTKEERIHFGYLQKELITAEKSETAAEKSETAHNNSIIAEEESKLNAKYDKILADIGDMRGALSK